MTTLMGFETNQPRKRRERKRGRAFGAINLWAAFWGVKVLKLLPIQPPEPVIEPGRSVPKKKHGRETVKGKRKTGHDLRWELLISSSNDLI